MKRLMLTLLTGIIAFAGITSTASAAMFTECGWGNRFNEDGTWDADPHTQPQPHTPTRPVPDADAAEDEVSEWVVAELEILLSQMEVKYPEIAELAELTPAEINQSLATESRAAFFDDLRDLFSLLSMDVTETALEETRQDLTENFGDEMADTIISQIRVEMGL